MQAVFKYLLGFGLCMIILMHGTWVVYSRIQHTNRSASSHQFVLAVIEPALRQWDYTLLEPFQDEDLTTRMGGVSLEEYFRELAPYGALQQIELLEGGLPPRSYFSFPDKAPIARYQLYNRHEHQDMIVAVELQFQDSTWQLYNLNIFTAR